MNETTLPTYRFISQKSFIAGGGTEGIAQPQTTCLPCTRPWVQVPDSPPPKQKRFEGRHSPSAQ
jgi:hypothetical protein